MVSLTKKICSLFIYQKGALAKAQGNVVLNEPVKLGVKGESLQGFNEYLKHRKFNVLFQREYFSVRDMKLEAPLGGVLSPTHFSVDELHQHTFPRQLNMMGMLTTYWVQAPSHRKLQFPLSRMGRWPSCLCSDGKGRFSQEEKKGKVHI